MAAKFCRILSNRRVVSKNAQRNSTLDLKQYTRLYCKVISAFYSSICPSDETIFTRARKHAERTAIVDDKGSFTYGSILAISQALGQKITERYDSECNAESLKGKRVAFLCPNDVRYVAVQWSIWRQAGIAVPLCEAHPVSMLEYFLRDSESTLLVSTEQFRSKVKHLVDVLNIAHIEVPNVENICTEMSELSPTLTPMEATTKCWDEVGAMIFYTSGTTGRPKGVLATHGNIRAQISGMVQAWEWTKDDCILHVLPLHHVHGVINVLCCSLWVGATCVMLPGFDPEKVWEYLTGSKLSLFMAVPTIYSKLIQYFQENNNYTRKQKEDIIKKCSQLRLMVSGSSALPEPTMKQWEIITGHTLLERYGMTEIGMALSNPLHGPRIPGSVGKPLPSVQVRIVAKGENNEECDDQVLVEGDEYGSKVFCQQDNVQGALQVKGPSVFKRYWGRPEATQESFTSDGWFRTGDDAEYKDGVYKIMGRASVDIIKSGGYKISALDIERELLTHPNIRDIAVLGVPDDVWGQRVAALVSLNPGKSLNLEDIRKWSEERLSRYQTPSLLKIVADIPRNTMGKVNKKQLVELFLNKE
ncbi:acyl-CoA synthetase family member 3, mitochondrial [Exaiptasia diaphana]|uniref:Acyl-CoA synthetase family member 3, mitochondrial n=1 Tax=Exaiptasia diaphana TaxID=2652724 RepID=A0A913XCV7_EXADI|nr:acyl-CoA synthetase family member 3, mitochondrial [Exaiptasia diaphana]